MWIFVVKIKKWLKINGFFKKENVDNLWIAF